jgi:2'-5' RNA ligase
MPGERNTSARLFFALWPDLGMRKALADAAQSAIRQITDADARVRPVPMANLHLTLVFLGAVPRLRWPAVEEAALRGLRLIRNVGERSTQRVQVTLDDIEHWHGPQVLCATASEAPAAVVRIVDSLGAALMAEGFAPDLKRPYRAHATLARKVRHAAHLPRIAPQVWTFESVALVESTTRPEGSEYAVVASWPLV